MHTRNLNVNYNNKTILEVFQTKQYSKLEELQEKINKLKEFRAPEIIIEIEQKEYDKLKTKLDNKTFVPYFTYRDGLDKSLLNTKISCLIEEQNRNGKVVAWIINDEIKIRFNTRYCPIIEKYEVE